MTDARTTGRSAFSEVRAAFENLETKDKAAFVLEAAFGTLGEAIEHAGRELSGMFEDLADEAAQTFADRDAPPESQEEE